MPYVHHPISTVRTCLQVSVSMERTTKFPDKDITLYLFDYRFQRGCECEGPEARDQHGRVPAARLHCAPLGAAEARRDPRALLPPNGSVAGATGAGGPGETTGAFSLSLLSKISPYQIAHHFPNMYTYLPQTFFNAANIVACTVRSRKKCCATSIIKCSASFYSL